MGPIDLAIDPQDRKIPKFIPCSDSLELSEVSAVRVGLINATPDDIKNKPG